MRSGSLVRAIFGGWSGMMRKAQWGSPATPRARTVTGRMSSMRISATSLVMVRPGGRSGFFGERISTLPASSVTSSVRPEARSPLARTTRALLTGTSNEGLASPSTDGALAREPSTSMSGGRAV